MPSSGSRHGPRGTVTYGFWMAELPAPRGHPPGTTGRRRHPAAGGYAPPGRSPPRTLIDNPDEATMCDCHQRTSLQRRAQFERFEPRELLSGCPWYDLRLMPGVTAPVQWQAGSSGREAAERLGSWQEYGLDGRGQTVAVIDSGIAYDHVALGGGLGAGYRVVGGWDFTDEQDADPYDDSPAGFHGTHVSGIIASDDLRYPGIAPGVDLVALRVFNDQGFGRMEWVERALQWVHEHQFQFAHPITTVNMSLGSEWNGDHPPDWATLEDELAQLQKDDIFVAVAAGNSFDDYLEAGLSYPAASPYAVPVASLNTSGAVSDFSQRHNRALAAVGEQITSTVPDYLYSFDGRTDDFLSASGTSMATPQVAGASVLLRQALDLSADSPVTAGQLYRLLRDTGQDVYDPKTGQTVHRIDIAAALDSILPDDESSEAASIELGSGTQTVTGWINTVDDVDIFTVTVPTTGVLTVTTESTGYLDPVWNNQTVIDGQSSWSLPVIAGQTYTWELSTGKGIGKYEITLQLAPDHGPPIDPVSLGTLAAATLPVDLAAGDAWFSIQAARTGWFTAESLSPHAQVALVSSSNLAATVSPALADSLRADAQVQAGQSLLLRVRGSQAPATIRLTNLVAVEDGQLTVHGTDADDLIKIDLSRSPRIFAGSTDYSLSTGDVRRIVVRESGGVDELQVIGAPADEDVRMQQGSISYRGESLELEGSAERLFVYGGGGTDHASLFDSAEDDRLYVKPGYSWLVQGPYVSYVRGFSQVTAYASSGDDTIRLEDSPGDDVLRAGGAEVDFSGEGFRVRAMGFDRSFAYATFGGHDRAELLGTVADDRLYARPASTFLAGGGSVHYTAGFDHVDAWSGGGMDVAQLYGGSTRDVLTADTTHAELASAGSTLHDAVVNRALGFAQVWAYAEGEGDEFFLGDSPADDRLFSKPTHTWQISEGRLVYGRGFDRVHATSSGRGFDQAELFDSPGDDQLTARPGQVVWSGPGFLQQVEGFDQVTARAQSGGHDVATFYDSAADDRFGAGPTYAWMVGPNYHHVALHFQRVAAFSTAGADQAVLTGSMAADRLAAAWRYGLLTGSDFRSEASGFATITARGGGGMDRAEMYNLQSTDLLFAEDNRVGLVRGGEHTVAEDFAWVATHMHSGQSPRTELAAIDFVLEQFTET